MAYAALNSLLQTLEQILNADNNQHLFNDKKKQIILSLQEKARNLQSFLERSWQMRDEAVGRLEDRIQNVAYTGEDLIESLNPQEDLQHVVHEIDSIMKEAVKNKDGVVPDSPQPRVSVSAGSSTPVAADFKNSTIVGFDLDMMQLKYRLTVQQPKLLTIPIVGMGGAGKTTLARNIYHDPLIVDHFDVRAWVTVPQEYSLREVLVCLLDCITILTYEQSIERSEKLAVYLQKGLIGRRYLIVIDDIWGIKACNDIIRLFPDANNGSRIMLTTRLLNLPIYSEPFSLLHQMPFLNEDESWELLERKVFLDEQCPHELEYVGKEIVKNCRGIPLTITVIGGLLFKSEKTKAFWAHVAGNISSVVNNNDEQCLKILSLSYDYLPHHLKSCFLYLGAFPEDYDIRVSKLFKMWATEGFIKPDESKSPDEVAMEYLTDLVSRNLILVRRLGSNWKIKSCSIHDLLWDLCLKEGHRVKFLSVLKRTVNTSLDNIDGQRRLIIHRNLQKLYDPSSVSSKAINDLLKLLSVARSFISVGCFDYPSSIYVCFRLLRVLDVAKTRFYGFPEQILRLSSLRYLAFTSDIRKIPSSISVLKNLETLIVRLVPYSDPVELPLELWKMQQLKHMWFTGCVLPPDPHPCVQTDGTVFVSPETSNLVTVSVVQDFRCTGRNSKRLQNLKKLALRYHSMDSEKWSCFCPNKLDQLLKLENLKCSFMPFFSAPPPKLGFPPNLKELTLDGSCLPWESMTPIGSLPKLEVLKLRSYAFGGPVWEPIEGQFRRLKYLKLQWLGLKWWLAKRTHFPRLEKLVLKSCFKLKEIPGDIIHIPTLQLIHLDGCSDVAVNSANSLKKQLQDSGINDAIEIIIEDFKLPIEAAPSNQ